MDKFENWPTAFLLSGLFLLCLFGFMSGLGINYNEEISSSYIDTSRIEEQINETSSDAIAWGEAFKSDNLLDRLLPIHPAPPVMIIFFPSYSFLILIIWLAPKNLN